MELNLKLPEHLFRKIVAYRVLAGLAAADIETAVLEMIDEVVTAKSITLLGGARTAPQPLPQGEPARRASSPHQDLEDPTGLALGLGDQDEVDADGATIPPASEEEFLPSEGGLTDEMLEHDLDVGDPQVEAAVEASPAPSTARGEDIFASSLKDEPDHAMEGGIRVRNRKNLPKRRGTVSPLNHIPAD